ncbi:MAG: ATP-binding protein [Kofleriaceae bacterium]
MNAPVTLDTCAQEPIHIPGSIQPHGVLLACRGDVIVQASTNTDSFLGVAHANVVGAPIGSLFQAESAQMIAAAFATPDRLREINPLRVITLGGMPFDAVLHVSSSGQLVVELEPAQGERILGFDPRLRTALIRLQHAIDLDSLYRLAAAEVRSITGFDRVMIYRFDPDWNGEVVAEAKRDGLEPFLGQHYPASDIPEQARRLYTINWLRFIGDASYTPVPVLPGLEQPLDMSFGILRSVSPIHIEYMKNMGVTASMSVSLVVDGVLVGLIACHNYDGPRLPSFVVRETCEYLGRSLSWNINVLETKLRAERAQRSAQRETSLLRSISESQEFLDGLASQALVELAEAQSAAIITSEGIRRIGPTPREETLVQLVSWLRGQPTDVFVTDRAPTTIPVPLGESAGVLAVAISRTLGEYVLWFRPLTERTINWAGDPNKVVVHTQGGAPRLSPRGSFDLWREVVRGRSLPWDAITIEAASNLRRSLLSGVRIRASELRSYNQRLLDADRAKDDFIATVSHELRTPLNAILGWANLLQQQDPIPPERLKQGLEVIDRNARAQTQIVDDLLDVSRMVSGKLSLDLVTVDLHDLVIDVLDSFEVNVAAKGLTLKRVLDSGTSMVLGDATRLRQIIVNLMTNATKFTPKGGSITVALRRIDSEFELSVRDSGQGISPEFLPLVFDVFRQADSGLNRRSAGLGLGLAIARKLVELHGGRITAESDGPGTGATFRIRIPVASVKLAAPTPPDGIASIEKPLFGMQILVVEDEDDSREFLCMLLTDAGAQCKQLSNAEEALTMLGREKFSLVISDVGMPGQDGLQFMRALRERGDSVPAVALTAYTRATDRSAALNAGYDAHLGKPVDTNELLAVVRSVFLRSKR